MIGWVALGLAAAGLYALTRNSSASTTSTPAEAGDAAQAITGNPLPPGGVALDELLARAGLSTYWRRVFLLIAARESQYVSNIYRGPEDRQPPGTQLSKTSAAKRQREIEAASQAYDQVTYLAECDWPRERYEVAGGAFGLLAPFGVRAYKGTPLACIDPWTIFDLAEAVPMAMHFAWRLIRNRKPKDTLDVLVGWGNPSRVGDPDQRATTRANILDELEQLGIPEAFLYVPIELFPDFDVVALRQRLVGEQAQAASLAMTSIVRGNPEAGQDLPRLIVLRDDETASETWAQAVEDIPGPAEVIIIEPPITGADLAACEYTTGALLPLFAELAQQGGPIYVAARGRATTAAQHLAATVPHMIAALFVADCCEGNFPGRAWTPTPPADWPPIVAFCAEHDPRQGVIVEGLELLEGLGADVDFYLYAGQPATPHNWTQTAWPAMRRALLEGPPTESTTQ